MIIYLEYETAQLITINLINHLIYETYHHINEMVFLLPINE